MKPVILCTVGSVFAQEGKNTLESIGDVTYATPTQEELPAKMKNVTALVVQLGLVIDRAVIDAAPNLRFIATATTGLDHIDVDYAESRGIRVLSLKEEIAFLRTVTATAELAFGLVIALIRHIPSAHESVRGGVWDRKAYQGRSLRGKTLGIVGYGRLGTMMGTYGQAFGMRVIYVDPHVPGGTDLETVLKESDIVTLHVHLDKSTTGMIDAKALALMKPDALLINTARALIVDEAALIRALKAGKIGGYAADVLADEFGFSGTRAVSPLIDYAETHDNVILCPHIGGMTLEARESTDIFIAQKLKTALESSPT